MHARANGSGSLKLCCTPDMITARGLIVSPQHDPAHCLAETVGDCDCCHCLAVLSALAGLRHGEKNTKHSRIRWEIRCTWLLAESSKIPNDGYQLLLQEHEAAGNMSLSR